MPSCLMSGLRWRMVRFYALPVHDKSLQTFHCSSIGVGPTYCKTTRRNLEQKEKLLSKKKKLSGKRLNLQSSHPSNILVIELRRSLAQFQNDWIYREPSCRVLDLRTTPGEIEIKQEILRRGGGQVHLARCSGCAAMNCHGQDTKIRLE